MPVPIAAAMIGYAGPRLLAGSGWLPRADPFVAVGDAAGLSLSMAISGGALLWGGAEGRTVGQRIAGVALMAYIPGYVLAAISDFVLLPGRELLPMMALLSDQVLLSILNLALLAIPIELARRQLQQAALRDPLTGAWNRAGFEVQKRRLLQAGATAIAIDIDHFKTINDRLGHAAGDEILMFLGREAGRLAQAHGGELARLGGDEFTVLLPACCAQPESFAERLREHLRAHADGSSPWSVSMGMATVAAEDADIGAVLRRADASLYRAKARGRGQIAG
jgi:diguanylate cyclase (GGDEF)-like protein